MTRQIPTNEVEEKLKDIEQSQWPLAVLIENLHGGELCFGDSQGNTLTFPTGVRTVAADLQGLTPEMSRHLMVGVNMSTLAFLFHTPEALRGRAEIKIATTSDAALAARSAPPKCECGLSACGGPARGPQHSHWCPMEKL